MGVHYQLFDTAIGACAVAWGEAGIVGTQLPMRTPADAMRRIGERYPGAKPDQPPPAVAEAIAGVIELLASGDADLPEAPLDFAGLPAFDAAVYDALRRIPPGETITYGELAARVGHPGAARAVGKAMGDNPWPILIPCHRVVGADGRVGGFSAPGGLATKARILTIERARLGADPLLFEALPVTVRPAGKRLA